MLLDKKKTRVRMPTLILQRKSQTSFPPGGNCGSGVPAHKRGKKSLSDKTSRAAFRMAFLTKEKEKNE
jgi:hypothetical protein